MQKLRISMSLFLMLVFVVTAAQGATVLYTFEGDPGDGGTPNLYTSITDKATVDGAQNATIDGSWEVNTTNVPFGTQAATTLVVPGSVNAALEMPDTQNRGSQFTVGAKVWFDQATTHPEGA